MLTINKNVMILMDTLLSFPEIDPTPLYWDRDIAYNNMRKEIYVYLPEDMERLRNSAPERQSEVSGQCKITCDDSDTYTMACKMYRELKPEGKKALGVHDAIGDPMNVDDIVEAKNSVKCMVLNFANPYHPGGGVRRGAIAQEENLCRRSSLLLSLESDDAKVYYSYNNRYSLKDEAGNDYGTNSLMLTPYV